MNPVYAAALGLQSFVRERGWQFCIIGGLAVIITKLEWMLKKQRLL